MIETDDTFGSTIVCCDECDRDETFDGPNGYTDSRHAIKEARENGWTIALEDGDERHYCPTCTSKKEV